MDKKKPHRNFDTDFDPRGKRGERDTTITCMLTIIILTAVPAYISLGFSIYNFFHIPTGSGSSVWTTLDKSVSALNEDTPYIGLDANVITPKDKTISGLAINREDDEGGIAGVYFGDTSTGTMNCGIVSHTNTSSGSVGFSVIMGSIPNLDESKAPNRIHPELEVTEALRITVGESGEVKVDIGPDQSDSTLGITGTVNITGILRVNGDVLGIPEFNATMCWDLDGDNLCDVDNEDINGDGECNVTDCQGPNGIHCWDLNENGECDLDTEDINEDGACNVTDCTGLQGTTCWDLNENGECDLDTEDINEDGACNVTDCNGIQGTTCWDLNENGECDLDTEDINEDGACNVTDCRGDTGPTGDQGPQGPAGSPGDMQNINTNVNPVTTGTYTVGNETHEWLSMAAMNVTVSDTVNAEKIVARNGWLDSVTFANVKEFELYDTGQGDIAVPISHYASTYKVVYTGRLHIIQISAVQVSSWNLGSIPLQVHTNITRANGTQEDITYSFVKADMTQGLESTATGATQEIPFATRISYYKLVTYDSTDPTTSVDTGDEVGVSVHVPSGASMSFVIRVFMIFNSE
jgi:hypothetical protein